MSYPRPTTEQRAFFRRHGWLIVENAIPQSALDEIERRCERIIDEKDQLAKDWAWDASEKRDARSFRIVQGSPTQVWPGIEEQPYRKWLVGFASRLMNLDLKFWYDQYLAKPPGNSAPTHWHQDEGYWGRNLDDRGITCWIPLQDVSPENGCMHFVDGGHRDGILTHRLVDGVKSDLLRCQVDEGRAVAAAIKRGSVTFHHSKTPHMTPANMAATWRKAVSNHMQDASCHGEGDHYPWKIYVNQRTGERIVPPSR